MQYTNIPDPVPPAVKERCESDELAVVLSAAVTAFLNHSRPTPSCEIRARSFRRISYPIPVWNETNRVELSRPFPL